MKPSQVVKIACLLLVLVLPAVAQAQYYYTNGLDIWSYYPDSGPVAITGYSGPGGDLVVPSDINGLQVTSIGYEAFFFFGNTSLTSITIPDTVTSIGFAAFDGCTGLPSITIPDGVTSIGDEAFANCTGLTSIAIPDSVSSLGAEVFYGCTSLNGITIGNSVTSIGDYAFYYCTSLTGVSIPDSVSSIGAYAFGQCTNLTGVSIPDSVTSIGDEAFVYCTSLTGVTIGSSVTSIGAAAFGDCPRLPRVAIPDSVTSIGEGAFINCYGLTNVTIGSGVTSIGENAFEECFSLTHVTMGGSVTSIGDYAFYICDSLSSITFPASVTNIGEYAFGDCDFTNVSIPAGVISIGDGAFFDCFDLTAIDVDENNGNYSSMDGVLFNKNKDTLVQCPGSKDGDYAIPMSVTGIGVEAFYDCWLLTSVTVPNSVTSIGDNTFSYCDSLTTVTIGSGVTSIGENAFDSCYSLASVTIGNGVTSIGSDAFADCDSLATVYFKGNSPTPTNDLTVFQDDTPGTVYYQPFTTGWGALFDGWPTMAVSNEVGGVVQITNTVTVKHPDGTTATLQLGDPIMEGDTVTTAAGAYVNIEFIDGTSIQLSGGKGGSTLPIDEYVYDPNSQTGSAKYNFVRGAFGYVGGLIDKTGDTVIQTAYGVLGIRGTQFISQQDPCSSTQMVYLIQGELAITPLDTPGVTNICDAPVTISLTTSSVTTNALDQATYDSISNQVFQSTGVVTFGSWIEQYFDCTNAPDAQPTADPSGDGEDNYSKFLAGMNPTNSASYFHILSATSQGNNFMVSWMCGGGRTNVLQATTNLGGSWSNVSPNIVLAGSGDSVTNYLDVGAVTNAPARFYRVQLVH